MPETATAKKGKHRVGGHRGHCPRRNARTIKPSKERINEYARSIAMYGILVPLIADRKGDAYHLQAGYTRLAAIGQLKADKALSTLAQLNGVDLEHVPVRGDDKGRLVYPLSRTTSTT